jgi:predicted ArsR family transcriptional regulator
MPWMDGWRHDDHLALECMLRVGGYVSATQVGEEMQTTTRAAWFALNRLVWRGVVECGPNKAGERVWRVRPEVLA